MEYEKKTRGIFINKHGQVKRDYPDPKPRRGDKPAINAINKDLAPHGTCAEDIAYQMNKRNINRAMNTVFDGRSALLHAAKINEKQNPVKKKNLIQLSIFHKLLGGNYQVSIDLFLPEKDHAEEWFKNQNDLKRNQIARRNTIIKQWEEDKKKGIAKGKRPKKSQVRLLKRSDYFFPEDKEEIINEIEQQLLDTVCRKITFRPNRLDTNDVNTKAQKYDQNIWSIVNRPNAKFIYNHEYLGKGDFDHVNFYECFDQANQMYLPKLEYRLNERIKNDSNFQYLPNFKA